MKIIQITSEIYPFTVPDRGNTDQLGYNIASLSHALSLRGHEVYVVSPLYCSISKEEHGIMPSNEKVWVTLQNNVYEFDIYEVARYGVRYIFLSNNILFDRRGLYGSGGLDFGDNDLRFGAFCQAALNYISHNIPDADILHSHNWQTALIPIYRKCRYSDTAWKDLFTIHDLANQGIFNRFSIETLGLPWDMYSVELLEFYDSINLLKGGVVCADAVTSLSPMQAESFLMHDSGYGLDGVFRKYQSKLNAITNGIDYKLWNPATDPNLAENYSVENIDRRYLNKVDLCRRYELPPTKPIFTVVNRYLRKMGIDKVLEILPQIMALDINLFLFGRSEEPNIAALLSQREIYPNLRIVSEDEEPIFNKLLAASDFFMAPYTHPFMGRDRRIAMRYGAVPIVRKYANELYYQMEEIVKFRYINMSDLPDVVARAIELYNDKEMMDRYRSDIMRFDNSWEESARKYEELYKKLTI